MIPTDGDEPRLAGRYRLGALLGRGGMAEVYDAFDERLARPVAVKVLRRDIGDTPGREARFAREARSAARLSHPGVVAIYDSGADQGRAFLVMERLPGDTLSDRMQAGPVDQRWLATCADQVLGGLAAAHDLGVVHRDIKPANILLTEDDRAKLADFGIAKTYTDEWATDQTADLTATGLVLGTVAYLSPEQIQGGAASPRSDIYGLGVVLYEALTGRKPFVGPNMVAQAHAAIEGELRDVASLRPDLNPAFAAVVRRAMARRPEDRFVSAQEMRAALGATGLVGAGRGAPVGGAVAPTTVLPAAVASSTAYGATTVMPPPTDPTDPNAPLTTESGGRRSKVAIIIIAVIVIIAIIVAAFLLTRHKPSSPSHTSTTSPTTTHVAAPGTTTAPTTSTSTSTTPPTTAPPTTLDPLPGKLTAYAWTLQNTGGMGPDTLAQGLQAVAATTQGAARAAKATQVLQKAEDLYAAGSITQYQYNRAEGLLVQAGAAQPTPPPTTTTAPTTSTTTTTTTTPSTTTVPTSAQLGHGHGGGKGHNGHANQGGNDG